MTNEVELERLAAKLRRDDPRVEDLRWYLHGWYEGEMGRRSTAGGQLDAIERGALVSGLQPGGEPGEREIRAAERLARVEAAWRRLPRDAADTLRSAYGPRPVGRLVNLDPQNALDGYAPRHDRAELVPLLGVLVDGWLLALEHRRWRSARSPTDWVIELQREVRKRRGRPCRERRLLEGLVRDAERRLDEALELYSEACRGHYERVQVEPVERRPAPVRKHSGRRWTLGELAAAKGVTGRAARKAFAEGKLPGAERSGRGHTAAVLVPDCCAQAYVKGTMCEVA